MNDTREKLIPFRRAFLQSDVEAMRRAAAEVPDLFRKLREQRPFPDWVLCDAAKDRSLEVMQTLIDLGADINEQDSNGLTGLRWAVIEGRHDAAKLLLERGADPNLNCAIFSVATSQGLSDRVGMAELLLDHGAKINEPFLVKGLPPRNVLSEAIGAGIRISFNSSSHGAHSCRTVNQTQKALRAVPLLAVACFRACSAGNPALQDLQTMLRHTATTLPNWSRISPSTTASWKSRSFRKSSQHPTTPSRSITFRSPKRANRRRFLPPA